MIEPYFETIVLGWAGLGLLILPVLLMIRAPYGRYTDRKWGPVISNRFGWFIMELPAFLVFPVLFVLGDGSKSPVTWVFFGLWVFHYVHRDLVFPWQLKTKNKKMPLGIMVFAVIFNFMNGFVNGYYFGYLSPEYSISWFYDPRFLIGLFMFLGGMYMNWHADEILFRLRKPGETGYKIPYGFMYKYISCPNYAGEIFEWMGFALMAWCLPALTFSLWTTVNLLPRALAHHKWYREQFTDYPAERKAVVPYIL
jgi:3-oxo-5-alpha-steroid 4-dehydrogenase 1